MLQTLRVYSCMCIDGTLPGLASSGPGHRPVLTYPRPLVKASLDNLVGKSCAEHEKSGLLRNLTFISPEIHSYFSPTNTIIRKISRRTAEFSHPLDAKPCWSRCPWTRSPSHAWSAKFRFAPSLCCNGCVSWQKNPGTCSTKRFLQATQR